MLFVIFLLEWSDCLIEWLRITYFMFGNLCSFASKATCGIKLDTSYDDKELMGSFRLPMSWPSLFLCMRHMYCKVKIFDLWSILVSLWLFWFFLFIIIGWNFSHADSVIIIDNRPKSLFFLLQEYKTQLNHLIIKLK